MLRTLFLKSIFLFFNSRGVTSVILRNDKYIMPRKIRELIRELEQMRFINRGGKGSHRNFTHKSGVRITISGNLGDDAKTYQEREVKKKIQESKK